MHAVIIACHEKYCWIPRKQKCEKYSLTATHGDGEDKMLTLVAFHTMTLRAIDHRR